MYWAEKDDPPNLKYHFGFWPYEKDWWDEPIKLVEFYEQLRESRVDVWILDNVVLFQRQLQRILGNKQNAMLLTESMNLTEFDSYVRFNWRPPDPRWWSLLKAVIGELILAARWGGVSVLATTEIGNKWKDYGKGKKQKVLGRTAKALSPWHQLLDAVWILSRTITSSDGTTRLREKPHIQMDLFSPKGSLVGIPAEFDWQGWDTFWEQLGGTPTDVTKLEEHAQEASPDDLAEANAAEAAVSSATAWKVFWNEAVSELDYNDEQQVKDALRALNFKAFNPATRETMWALLSTVSRGTPRDTGQKQPETPQEPEAQPPQAPGPTE